MNKNDRRRLILALVATGGMRSHRDLRTALAGRGVAVAQGTLSRDLKALGLSKGRNGWTGAREATAVAAVQALKTAFFLLS